ncbi:hypothetical protein CERSUDRAFT_90811 [Gelatoporia subvermispora B]|uniref:Uncharacterized protein n=1 Tax=Ceriporiopsis subvermispora (strain B) TaxID=914234 RepID=M2PZ47_CERS8|nr:hypothetical protein CERSUDRAFT_90811 [Gelatoporia subvermispora B]
MVADILILFATWRNTYTLRRRSAQHGVKTPLATLLFRDGTLHFTVLLIFNILQIVGDTTDSFAYASDFFIPVSSVIITHFLLNLRQVANEPHDELAKTQLSSMHMGEEQTIRFASFVGNMGETLDYSAGLTVTTASDMTWEKQLHGEDPESIARMHSGSEAARNPNNSVGADVENAFHLHETGVASG